MANIDYRNSEADTRAELIDPTLKECGWVTGGDVIVRREYPIKKGRIIGKNARKPSLSADYVLIYKNNILGIVEAKKSSLSYTEGVAQAKEYAELLKVRFTYATNGKDIYQIDMETGEEKAVDKYPTPDELWNMTYTENNELWNLFSSVPLKTDGRFELRYYQQNAVNAALKALCQNKKRILLTLATGTGKTCIAFQIIWKLMQTKWNTNEIGSRLPRILFLADRNILANQAFNSFDSFDQNALARIKPDEIRKNDYKVPTSQSIFFTIFQTFMSGEEPYFGQYNKDFFDLIIIDECHRGGAKDESNWRSILEYFNSAVQIGLTATPKRKANVDTYNYFGEPVYQYKLKDAIEDGYLTPFRVREIKTNFSEYQYNSDDEVKGEIDTNKLYKAGDFNSKIVIKEREIQRVKAFMSEINQNDKTLVFCATQEHAGLIRDLINQEKTVTTDPNYCVRVTAEDGETGEEWLRKFQDTDKTIPTILTTSQKLSTGVDAIQIKNIVILRPVTDIVEFKQIVGRGTRLCDGKAYFTIYDFENASERFKDPEWDGEPEPPMWIEHPPKIHTKKPVEPKEKIYVKLGKGREVEILSTSTTFYDNETGKPISAKEFIEKLIGILPNFFKSEEELRTIWQDPQTRSNLLRAFDSKGYSKDTFDEIKRIITGEDNDIFDVIQYLAYNTEMKSRQERAEQCRLLAFDNIESRKHAFIDFVLQQYVKEGVGELDPERVGELIKLKYGTPINAIQELGDIKSIKTTFSDFQKYLYIA